MGQAKARKAEIIAIKANNMTAVEFVERIKIVVAEKYNWTTGYSSKLTDKQNAVLAITIQILAERNKVTAKMLQQAYPNEGTYTYTDGIVDLVLGALHPLARMQFAGDAVMVTM